jgi:hypothetical protein
MNLIESITTRLNQVQYELDGLTDEQNIQFIKKSVCYE